MNHVRLATEEERRENGVWAIVQGDEATEESTAAKSGGDKRWDVAARSLFAEKKARSHVRHVIQQGRVLSTGLKAGGEADGAKHEMGA